MKYEQEYTRNWQRRIVEIHVNPKYCKQCHEELQPDDGEYCEECWREVMYEGKEVRGGK